MKTERLKTKHRYMLNQIIQILERITPTAAEETTYWTQKETGEIRLYNMLVHTRRMLESFVHPPEFLKAMARQDVNVDITGIVWFTGTSNIGIVTIKNLIGEEKAYIGTHTGMREQDDIVNIAEYGTKFPINQAKDLVRDIGSSSILKYKYGKLV